jgi:hypothetical protein
MVNAKEKCRRWDFHVPDAKAKKFENTWPGHDTNRTAALLKAMELYIEKEGSA